MKEVMNNFGRRSFLKMSATAGLLAMGNKAFASSSFLSPVSVENPLKAYPSRDWESIYRDMFHTDNFFVFLCVPNDTHNCLLKAHVKNDVVVRISPSYKFGEAESQDGGKASHRWDPRCCNKGLVLARRVYSDRRPKGAMVRKGFKEWADAGYPRDGENGFPEKKYLQRGKEPFIKLPWDEAFALCAKTMANVAQTYSGEKGVELLTRQGYDHDVIHSMHGAGTMTMKFRGAMALLGITRIFGIKRMANMMALLDAHVRKVGPDEAKGGKGLDSYTWHTDLAPGTPMTTGFQCMDYDLATMEHANLILLMGTNTVATKMPDLHWVSEARLKGTHIVDVSIDYHATSNKADDVVIIRPGTDAAYMLGMAHVLIKEKLYDENYLLANTDLPLLVRTDTWTNLKAADVIEGYKQADLSHHLKVLGDKEPVPMPIAMQETHMVRESLRKEWGDAMVWDKKTNKATPLSRDHCGGKYKDAGVDPALSGEFSVKLLNGKTIKVVPSFQLIKDYIDEYTPENVANLCGCPKEAVIDIARMMGANRGKTIVATGAGNNHYFNSHLKDRVILLVGALTDNIGHIGGCMFGNFVGNYPVAVYAGLVQYYYEDPFNIQLTPPQMENVTDRNVGMADHIVHYAHGESAHYYNYGDRPLRVGNRCLTDPGHMPSPTKVMCQVNSNSSIGNSKWHYDLVINSMPKWEMVCYSDWNWTASCEYSDIVWGVDSWMETKHTCMSASCTNSFIHTSPATPMKRVHDTRGDMEVYAGISRALTDVTGDKRFADYWHFVGKPGETDPAKTTEVYLQRIFNGSSGARGYDVVEVRKKGKQGIPTLMMNRTYPKVKGWEQVKEGKPYATKTGRLEFYKDDARLIEAGENLPIYREPVDSTRFEPNVIVGKSRAFELMATPESYGLETNGNSLDVAENRQARNVVMTTAELMKSQHPLKRQLGYDFCFNSPKYRHGAHTTPIDTDLMTLWWGPFGDIYRHDKRTPSSGEGFADINPDDAKKHGIDEGDYMWIDADPGDRPYRGWKEGTPEYELSRFKVRARYFLGMSPGTIRMYMNAYGATYGSMEGQKTRADGLAKNPRTNYQAMMRSGSHQSCTRAWLAPTLQTDSMTHKNSFGQLIVKGFEADVHCTNGAPKESFVKISLAEKGGLNGGLWRPAALGYRPTYENETMARYLKGEFTS